MPGKDKHGVAAGLGPVSGSRDASLKTFLQNYLRDQQFPGDQTRFSFAFVDLNGGGARQAIVYLTGSFWCGSGGCTALILDREGATYRVVTRLTVTRPPIYVLKSMTDGWHDIAVFVAGGGILNGYEARLSFNRRRYSGNPTIAPANPITGKVDGTMVISPHDNGSPLYP
ncbi:MAG: hypothetical protein ACRD3Y_03640 [Bryobacteraceae bacterium]